MKIVLVYSGGMDSTVLLYHLLSGGHEVKAISFDYGQRHRKEIDAARAICALQGIEHRIADLSSIGPRFLYGSSQTDPSVPVPSGHYQEESMKATVVPARNTIMASIAAGWAIALKFDSIALAIHAGDHAIYPDCRLEWLDAMRRLFRYFDWEQISIDAPFVGLTKRQIAERGQELDVPFHLTWTCYAGKAIPCGVCGSCIERAEALEGIC